MVMTTPPATQDSTPAFDGAHAPVGDPLCGSVGPAVEPDGLFGWAWGCTNVLGGANMRLHLKLFTLVCQYWEYALVSVCLIAALLCRLYEIYAVYQARRNLQQRRAVTGDGTSDEASLFQLGDQLSGEAVDDDSVTGSGHRRWCPVAEALCGRSRQVSTPTGQGSGKWPAAVRRFLCPAAGGGSGCRQSSSGRGCKEAHSTGSGRSAGPGSAAEGVDVTCRTSEAPTVAEPRPSPGASTSSAGQGCRKLQQHTLDSLRELISTKYCKSSDGRSPSSRLRAVSHPSPTDSLTEQSALRHSQSQDFHGMRRIRPVSPERQKFTADEIKAFIRPRMAQSAPCDGWKECVSFPASPLLGAGTAAGAGWQYPAPMASSTSSSGIPSTVNSPEVPDSTHLSGEPVDRSARAAEVVNHDAPGEEQPATNDDVMLQQLCQLIATRATKASHQCQKVVEERRRQEREAILQAKNALCLQFELQRRGEREGSVLCGDGGVSTSSSCSAEAQDVTAQVPSDGRE